MTIQEISKFIEAMQTAKNVSDKEVCERAGVTRATLCNLKNGKGTTADTLASVLGAIGYELWVMPRHE